MYWTYRASPVNLKTTGSFNIPFSENGLEAWFDESFGTEFVANGDLKKWTSRVNGHFVEQTGSSNRPAFTAVSADVNGKGFMTFDGSTDYLYATQNSTLAQLGTGSVDFTIFVLMRADSDGAGNDGVFSWGNGAVTPDGTHMLVTANGALQTQINNTSSAPSITTVKGIHDDEFHIVTTAFGAGNVQNWDTRIDGQNQASVLRAVTMQDAVIDQFNIGKRLQTNGEILKGSISEVIIYTRILAFEEIVEVEAYLFDKYFLPENFDGLFEWFKPGVGVQT